MYFSTDEHNTCITIQGVEMKNKPKMAFVDYHGLSWTIMDYHRPVLQPNIFEYFLTNIDIPIPDWQKTDIGTPKVAILTEKYSCEHYVRMISIL